jgi:hypothetical protein
VSNSPREQTEPKKRQQTTTTTTTISNPQKQLVEAAHGARCVNSFFDLLVVDLAAVTVRAIRLSQSPARFFRLSPPPKSRPPKHSLSSVQVPFFHPRRLIPHLILIIIVCCFLVVFFSSCNQRFISIQTGHVVSWPDPLLQGGLLYTPPSACFRNIFDGISSYSISLLPVIRFSAALTLAPWLYCHDELPGHVCRVQWRPGRCNLSLQRLQRDS